MARLFHIPFSPWSEKARWALDHHRIAYELVEHIPLVGEARLRILMRKPTGRVTVPVLEDRGAWYTDSFDIALHADTVGAGPRLIPPGQEGDVEAWNLRSEEALAAGRAMLMLKSANDPEAARNAIPPGVPAALQPLLLPVARKGIDAFIAKYRMRDGAGSHERVLGEALEALEAALRGGRRYLLGDALSYADIAMAAAIQVVSPVDERFMAIGPGGRAAWTQTALAEKHAGLLAWRDALYAQHRRRA
jgi:glutathione S-transferase